MLFFIVLSLYKHSTATTTIFPSSSSTTAIFIFPLFAHLTHIKHFLFFFFSSLTFYPGHLLVFPSCLPVSFTTLLPWPLPFPPPPPNKPTTCSPQAGITCSNYGAVSSSPFPCSCYFLLFPCFLPLCLHIFFFFTVLFFLPPPFSSSSFFPLFFSPLPFSRSSPFYIFFFVAVVVFVFLLLYLFLRYFSLSLLVFFSTPSFW